MMIFKPRTYIGLVLFLFSFISNAQDSQPDELKVMIDCRGCNESYMQQNSLFLTHVRDQSLADVYLLINRTWSPSSEIYNMEYVGKGEFEGMDFTYSADFSRTLTYNETRDGLLQEVLKGFIPYILKTNLTDKFKIVVAEESEGTENNVQKDPWNNWVFEVRGEMRLRDQETREELNYELGFDGDKVSQNWRVRINGIFRRNILNIDRDDGTEFTSVREFKYFGTSVVKSLGDHWSAGIFSNIENNNVDNFQLRLNVSPAVEYSLFDYREVLTREITFAYKIGYNYQKYLETTIFEVDEDRFPSQSFSVNVRFRKDWGYIFSSVAVRNFLNDFSKNRISIDNRASIRIFKGLFASINADFDMIRDQINLQLGDASLEDIILQQRAIATNYRLNVGLGLSYTFGSIYNNILNTRL
ncbi:MAG: hypothetical protein RLO17_09155 [Cyclobacteriaceae bacterium]